MVTFFHDRKSTIMGPPIGSATIISKRIKFIVKSHTPLCGTSFLLEELPQCTITMPLVTVFTINPLWKKTSNANGTRCSLNVAGNTQPMKKIWNIMHCQVIPYNSRLVWRTNVSLRLCSNTRSYQNNVLENYTTS